MDDESRTHAKSTTTGSETIASVLHGSYSLSSSSSTYNCQIGTSISRWYDKLQLIVSSNGQAGVNFEHSVVDGHTVLRFASDVFTDTIVRFAQTISGPRVGSFIPRENSNNLETSNNVPNSASCETSTKWSKRRAKAVKKLEFKLNDEIKQEMKFAEAKLGDAISKCDVEVLEFCGYGKLFIVQSRMSPDAFVQIAILSA